MTVRAPSRLTRRTIDVLVAVASRPEGIGLTDVARESAVPKATCHRVLTVLEDDGWVSIDPGTRRYRIGLGLLSVVSGLLGPDSATAHLNEAVQDLAVAAQETAGFDVLALPDVAVLVQVAGPQLIGQRPLPVPVRQPAWRTSTGKAMLATRDDAELDVLLPDLGAQPGGPAPAQQDAFRTALVRTRERGWATTVDELEPGASSVAAAVRLPGRVPYALWVGGPTFRLSDGRLDELGALVAHAAARLSATLTALGAGPPPPPPRPGAPPGTGGLPPVGEPAGAVTRPDRPPGGPAPRDDPAAPLDRTPAPTEGASPCLPSPTSTASPSSRTVS
ncbi:MAG TPA: IclR family transcriptional regulator [Cellulomonas sp.]